MLMRSAIRYGWYWCWRIDRKIIDTIPNNKKPQVTFSCKRGPTSNNSTTPSNTPPNTSPYPSSSGLLFAPFAAGGAASEMGTQAGLLGEADGVCSFQFWVDSVESFYCKLEGCGWEGRNSAGKSYFS